MRISRRAKRDAKRLFRLCVVDARLDEGRARRVVQSLLTAGRRRGPATLAHFLRLVKLDRARHTALVESAEPLLADVQTEIVNGLKQRYGLDVAASFAEHPALIGGVRIRVGSDVYDGSVQAGLAALEESFRETR